MTLGDHLGSRDNALSSLRLLLAGIVIASHAPSIGGFGPEPRVGGGTLGAWAVAGFFAISGYLVSGSRERLSWQDFALARMLRIYPGYWGALCAVALGFAPIGAVATGSPVDLGGGLRFVAVNVLVPVQWAFGDAIGQAARPEAWDGPLWTLTHEMLCYVVAGVALTWRLVRSRPGVCAAGALTAVTAASLILDELGVGTGRRAIDLLHLLGFFLAGALLWALREHVHARWSLGALSFCALVVVGAAGAANQLAALPLAYLVLALGAALPIRIGAVRDLSYGLYIFGWPVQTTLYLLGASALGSHAFLLLSLAATLPCAWASWAIVESRALRLRRSAPSRSLGHPDVPHLSRSDTSEARACQRSV
ncbi:acyltransferase family protein [Pedococcus sp. 5OH_020]|uniref:acyltransferase family protein n=1 Tax=Pedococcus sp. 5OH_020 TaxID=2989814 RepID=UPI0022E9FCCF|nr:acyltransferase [Pedococcus sp. 5OH_020]